MNDKTMTILLKCTLHNHDNCFILLVLKSRLNVLLPGWHAKCRW